MRFERVDYDLESLRHECPRSTIPDELAAKWFDFTRRGVVVAHGLQTGPSPSAGERNGHQHLRVGESTEAAASV